MKLNMLKVAVVILTSALFTKLAHAADVVVSSSTVTTIVPSSAGRAFVVLYNNSTNPVYYDKFTSSATVAAGMVLPASGTVTLEGFKGSVYGTAGAGATADVRWFTISR
jgi:ABC-type taurine transport system substrate-binding protein